MSHHAPRLEDAVMTRRELLCRSGMGMGALALGGMLAEQGLLGRAARGGDNGVDTRPDWPLPRAERTIRSCPSRRRCEPGPSGSSTCS